MVRGIVVSLLCLLAMPSAAQYNIKKMMEEGRRTLDRGYYVASMQIFTRIVALKPNLYEAWYLMALSKYHLEDYKGAGEDCRRALDLQPYIAEIYELYGMVSIREEHYDSAVVAYTMPWKSVPITVMTGSTVLTAYTRRVTDRLLSASWIIFSAAGRILKRLPGCTMTSLPGADLSRSPYVRPAGRSSRCRVWLMVETLQY